MEAARLLGEFLGQTQWTAVEARTYGSHRRFSLFRDVVRFHARPPISHGCFPAIKWSGRGNDKTTTLEPGLWVPE